MLKTITNKVLDDLSRSILKELCQDARISTTEIGRRVGLSAPAVAERIQKLEKQGFIKGYRTIIDFDKIGLSIKAIITFKSTTLKHSESIKMIDAMPEVVEWHAITGNYCMILKVAVETSKELELFIEHLAEYGETSTSLILSESKGSKVLS
ncbi:MAG: Lrp/AsnC family transcriptional regulator [Bacteroidetes bacterium]|nr:Lrp/AsnC family transcriptional regulator [Bacteroidota bacterium]